MGGHGGNDYVALLGGFPILVFSYDNDTDAMEVSLCWVWHCHHYHCHHQVNNSAPLPSTIARLTVKLRL